LLQFDHPAAAAYAGYLSDDLAELHGLVERGDAITLRDQFVTRNTNDPVRSEFSVAMVKDDLARLKQIRGLAPHCEHVAGPDRREHA
jgi:hypothetical protein